MILVIDFGLSNLKYSLWDDNSVLKISIRERTDKTDFALAKSIEKTYNEYVEFASNYLELTHITNDAIDKVLVIASKHPEQTKSKPYVIDYVKDDMRNDIRNVLKDRLSVEISNNISDNSPNNQVKKNKKKSESKTNIYNYSEQIVDNEFNYIQNILGAACNTDYLYKLTVAFHSAGVQNYSVLDPAQVSSRLVTSTEPTLVLDIGHNTYYSIVAAETMDDGTVIKNVIKGNDAIKIGARVIDDALLNKGFTQDEIWNEKINNTYSDLESTLNINYMDIIETVSKEIEVFTETNKKEITNIILTGGALNQLNLKDYLLDNIKGLKVAKNSARINKNDTYKLKLIEPYSNTTFSNLPTDIKNYFYTSYAAYNLYIEKSNIDSYTKFQKGRMIDFLETETKFLNSFKAVKTLKKLTKYNIIASTLLTAMCLGIVSQWHLYKNLGNVYGDKAATVASEKQSLTSQISQIDSEISTVEQDLLTETYDWSKILNAIALATPKGIQITSITTGDGGDTDTVLIKGYTDSRFKISDMSTLLKDSMFNEAEIQEITSTETLIKAPIQEFTIKCTGKR